MRVEMVGVEVKGSPVFRPCAKVGLVSGGSEL